MELGKGGMIQQTNHDAIRPRIIRQDQAHGCSSAQSPLLNDRSILRQRVSRQGRRPKTDPQCVGYIHHGAERGVAVIVREGLVQALPSQSHIRPRLASSLHYHLDGSLSIVDQELHTSLHPEGW